MRRSLIFLVAIMFLLVAVTSFAGDAASTPKPTASGCPMMQSKGGAATDSAKASNPHACCAKMSKGSEKAKAPTANDPLVITVGESKPMDGCPMMGKASAETPSTSAEVKEATATGMPTTAASAPKIGETCPDVTGKTALSNFHEVMSPMHMAFEDNKYDEMKSSMPKLIEVSKGIASYKCPMNDKCSPDCLKKFDERKAVLLNGVDELDLAFKGNDNKKIDTAFMTMHQAFVDFAGMCNPGAKGAETKTTEAKTK